MVHFDEQLVEIDRKLLLAFWQGDSGRYEGRPAQV